GVDGRRYDKCSTPDGRDGICVAKLYCREALSQSLVPCEGGDSYCCPIPTVQRSAETSPRNESPYDKNQPRTQYDDGGSRNPTNSHDRPVESSRPRENGRNPSRPTYDDGQERKPVSPHDRPVDLNPNPPRSKENRGSVGRPMNDERIEKPKRVLFENDPRVYEDRSEKPLVRDKPSGHIPEEPRRKPLYESNQGREIPSSSRPRPKIEEYDDEARRRPEPAAPNHYPSVEEIEPPKNPRPYGEPNHSSKPPNALPRPQDRPAAQPQVPSCGVKPYELFIAGGEASEAHEWPWMTAIFRRHQSSRPKVFLCGGSLINRKYVITAAHCFTYNYVILPASSFVVRLGSHTLNSGEEYTVSNLVIHPNHTGTDFFNDIALVRLASEVYITDKIAPICLPFPEMINENFVGRLATVAGWGDNYFRKFALFSFPEKKMA
ncbi:limulus clotting factor C, partial [Nephila pilipes]